MANNQANYVKGGPAKLLRDKKAQFPIGAGQAAVQAAKQARQERTARQTAMQRGMSGSDSARDALRTAFKEYNNRNKKQQQTNNLSPMNRQKK